MATATQLISLEEYLRTSYHPDRDFVEGELQERNVGEREHNRLQLLLGNWFYSKEHEWQIYVLPEQRTRVSSQKVRVPDVCLLRADAPRESVTTVTPLLCIEILSPEDRLPRVAKVLDDYLAMGVENLWILDPIDHVAYTYSGNGNLKLVTDRITVPGTPIYIDLASLFRNLD